MKVKASVGRSAKAHWDVRDQCYHLRLTAGSEAEAELLAGIYNQLNQDGGLSLQRWLLAVKASQKKPRKPRKPRESFPAVTVKRPEKKVKDAARANKNPD